LPRRTAGASGRARRRARGRPAGGGRCRSYHDPRSTWKSTTAITCCCPAIMRRSAICKTIGTADRLAGPPHADFPFVDLKTGERWTLRIATAACRGGCSIATGACRARARAIISLSSGCCGRGGMRRWATCSVRRAALRAAGRTAAAGRAQHGAVSRSAALAAAVLRETIAAGGPRPAAAERAQRAWAPFMRPRSITARARRAIAFGIGCGRSMSRTARAAAVRRPVRLDRDDRAILAWPSVVATGARSRLQRHPIPRHRERGISAHGRRRKRAIRRRRQPAGGMDLCVRDRLSVTITAPAAARHAAERSRPRSGARLPSTG